MSTVYNLGNDYVNVKASSTVKLNEGFTVFTQEGPIQLSVDIIADFADIPEKYHEVFMNVLTSKYINKVSYHIDFELCILSLIKNLNIISVKEALLYQTFDNSNNTDNREYPLIIDKLLIRNDVNYFYKTVLFSIKSLNINISINTIIIFLLGFYIYPYAIILLLFEYLYKSNNMISNNLLLLSIGFLFKILYLKIIL